MGVGFFSNTEKKGIEFQTNIKENVLHNTAGNEGNISAPNVHSTMDKKNEENKDIFYELMAQEYGKF